MREGTSDCGGRGTLLASASSGVGSWAPNDRAAQYLPSNSESASMGESRKACRDRSQVKQDGRQCARVQMQMRQEPEAGQEQDRRAAVYDALTREGGEPVRIGGKWTYQEGTRSSGRVGSGRVVRGGKRPS